MYFIYMYMALDFARNTTEHKELWPHFSRTKIHGKVQNLGSFYGVWQITKVHLSLACVGLIY